MTVSTDLGGGVFERRFVPSRNKEIIAWAQLLPVGLNAGNGTGASITALAANGDIWLASFYAAMTRSTDDGLTWSAVTNPTGSQVYDFDINTSSGVWIGALHGDELIRSTDDGLTWSVIDPGIVGSKYGKIRSDGNGVWVAVCNQYSGVTSVSIRSTDDGLTWSTLPSYLNVTGMVQNDFWNGLDTDGAGTWIAVTYSGFASKSTDNGVTWNHVLPTGLNGGGGSNLPSMNAVATDGSGTWVVIGHSGKGRHSSDNGITWIALPEGLNSGITNVLFEDIAWTGKGFVAVGRNGRCAKSDITGLTWTELPLYLNMHPDADDITHIASSGTATIASGKWGQAARIGE